MNWAVFAAGVLVAATATAHCVVMHRFIVRPTTELLAANPAALPPIASRMVAPLMHVSSFAWLVAGLALMLVATPHLAEGREAIVIICAVIVAQAALINFAASRGRHPGWLAMGGALCLLVLGQ